MTTKPKATLAELLALWTIQEALLQSYRTIFITMQSIFIAIAAAVLSSSEPWVAMTLLTVLGLLTLYLWISICGDRGKTVYLTQFFVLCAEQDEDVFEPLKRLKHFQGNPGAVERRDPRYLALGGGKTRWKMERLLPTIFLAAWAFLWAILILQHYSVAFLPKAAGT